MSFFLFLQSLFYVCASTVVPPRTFANSLCLCFPLSIFLFLQSIVCAFHCRSSTYFRQFLLSLFSAVHLSCFISIFSVIFFPCRSFSFFRQFSLYFVYDVVLSLF